LDFILFYIDRLHNHQLLSFKKIIFTCNHIKEVFIFLFVSHHIHIPCSLAPQMHKVCMWWPQFSWWKTYQDESENTTHKEKKNLMATKTQNLEMNLHIFFNFATLIEFSYDAYAFLQNTYILKHSRFHSSHLIGKTTYQPMLGS
jgi:hypothetical protein